MTTFTTEDRIAAQNKLTCLDCGKTLTKNSIHTCSPQLKTLTKEMNNEPVAWMDYLEHSNVYDLNVSGRGIPLYTHPAKTLTVEEIEAEWFKVFKPEAGLGKNLTNGIFEFAKAILKKARNEN